MYIFSLRHFISRNVVLYFCLVIYLKLSRDMENGKITFFKEQEIHTAIEIKSFEN